ncbi:AI-2E family transporter [Variovorax saccharolyticus]|uniref:AI-2E family transporter n=1 Tax=Variovorax saccharolyticus TaxID=3053516 RepID=UPI002575ECA0|nr:AI-2E family transporter [Variovorax sp. J31P216]MDM0028322.1 AI-2E family transporter [Variovorax sp. J31P216]
MNTASVQRTVFFILLTAVTLGFLWILQPFFGAVMWAVALAILFSPLYRWFSKAMGRRKSLAAFVTLLLCTVVVVLPLAAVGASLVQDIMVLSDRIQTGQLNFAAYFERIVAASPRWLTNLMNRFGLGDMRAIQLRIEGVAAQGSQLIAARALSVGQNTFEFVVSFGVMLYLLFFLLRDGAELSKIVRDTFPLAKPHTHYLLNKFTTVTRATIKGNVAVAVVQGGLGGLAFWFLGVQGALVWGVLMAFLSLLPAIGAALIWLPVALYLLAVGSILKGVGLIAFCAVVIGLVDNFLRPQLVGKETQMPDYIVLMSTIGGMAIFGINGFVLGPIIAALFMTAWSLFADMRQADMEADLLAQPSTSDLPDARALAPLIEAPEDCMVVTVQGPMATEMPLVPQPYKLYRVTPKPSGA